MALLVCYGLSCRPSSCLCHVFCVTKAAATCYSVRRVRGRPMVSTPSSITESGGRVSDSTLTAEITSWCGVCDGRYVLVLGGGHGPANHCRDASTLRLSLVTVFISVSSPISRVSVTFTATGARSETGRLETTTTVLSLAKTLSPIEGLSSSALRRMSWSISSRGGNWSFWCGACTGDRLFCRDAVITTAAISGAAVRRCHCKPTTNHNGTPEERSLFITLTQQYVT